MERRIQVSPGVRHHFDLTDLKLHPGSISSPGGLAAQVVAEDRTGKARIRGHPVLNGVAEIYQGHAEKA
jgi:hypothetical protein